MEATVHVPFFVTATGFPAGLVGTVGVRVTQGSTVVIARQTTNIVEAVTGSGIYVATLTLTVPGRYQAVWDDGSGLTGVEHFAEEDIDVAPDAAVTLASMSGPFLGTVAMAKSYVTSLRGKDTPLGAEDELFLTTLLASFSDFLSRYTGRKFFPEPAFVEDPPGSGIFVDPPVYVPKKFAIPVKGSVRIPDLRVPASINIGGIDLMDFANDFFEAYWLTKRDNEPATHFKISKNYFAPYQNMLVEISGKWGFVAPPPTIIHPCMLLTARAFMQKQSRWADMTQAGMDSAGFSYLQTLPGPTRMMVENLRPGRIAFI